MKKIFFDTLFWLSWPASWLYLRGSTRSRVLLAYKDQAVGVKGWLGEKGWGLPGGGMHKGENPKQGAIREVREELGIKLNSKQLKELGKHDYKHRGLSYSYYAFAISLASQPKLKTHSLEIRRAAWLPMSEIYTSGEPDVRTVLDAWRATE